MLGLEGPLSATCLSPLTLVVELRKPPVDEPQLSLLVVDHHVVWLNIPVHDAVRVAVIERLEQLVDVVPDVEVRQGGVQHFEVHVVHVFKDEARSLALRIANHIQQLNDVLAAA